LFVFGSLAVHIIITRLRRRDFSRGLFIHSISQQSTLVFRACAGALILRGLF